MREIKFRAKTILGTWVYGHYTQGSETMHYLTKPDGTVNIIDPETLSQFTGLHDKNGVEIYDGDMVVCDKDGFNGEIKYEVQKAGFWLYNKTEKKYRELHLIGAYGDANGIFIDAEIIGNIYEPLTPKPL